MNEWNERLAKYNLFPSIRGNKSQMQNFIFTPTKTAKTLSTLFEDQDNIIRKATRIDMWGRDVQVFMLNWHKGMVKAYMH
jgi:hypothetical protein